MSDQPAKPHLSPSSLETLSKCGERWRRVYVEGERIPPGMAMLRGTGVHKGIEANMSQKIETHVDLPASDIVDAAVAGFEAELAGGFELSADEVSIGAKKVIGDTKDVVADLAELAANKMCPEYQPTLVEQRVRVLLPQSSHDLVGIIDLVDDKGRVIDTKTSAKSMTQGDADSSMQLTAYAAMHKALTGEYPTELRLENLVALKTPKRQTLVTDRDVSDINVLAARFDAATRVIQAGVFTPASPGSWYCSPKWCGFYASCPFVNGGRAPQGD